MRTLILTALTTAVLALSAGVTAAPITGNQYSMLSSVSNPSWSCRDFELSSSGNLTATCNDNTSGRSIVPEKASRTDMEYKETSIDLIQKLDCKHPFGNTNIFPEMYWENGWSSKRYTYNDLELVQGSSGYLMVQGRCWKSGQNGTSLSDVKLDRGLCNEHGRLRFNCSYY